MNELNEKELQYIISEVSNSLLNEIKVMDAYQKYYSDVPSYIWEEIIGRLQKDRNGNFVNDLLPETKWVLKLYKAKSPRLVEDLYKLKNENGDGYLDIFLRAKERRMIQGIDGDLNRFKSIAELGTYVSSLDVDTILGRTKGEMSNAVHDAKDDIEKLYEDDEWIILIPKTHEASCYWAKGAHWCTAYRDSDDYFKEYSSQGPLFMNIHKENPQLSTQFHLESDQYMDYYDSAIDEPIFEHIHDGDTLLDFYQGYLPAEKFIKMVGSELGNGLYAAYLYDYDYGEDGHDDEYAYFMVDINMNRIAGPFEDMYNFNGNDVTRVIYDNSKYNLVDTKGNLQFDEPLLDIRVCGNNKNKFIGRTCNSSSMDDEGNITVKETTHVVTYNNGKVQHFPQYDYYTYYHEGFSIVRGKDNFNVLNSDFQPIFKDDYLNVRPYSLDRKQYFAIQKEKLCNLADINGNILWDNWVYNIAPNLTIEGLPIKTFKVNTGIGLNLYDVNGNPMMSEDVEKFTWSNWKTDGVVSGVMMLNGDYNFLDNKFNIIDRDGKILYKGLYEPMNENRKTLNENYHGEIYHFTSLIQGSWIVDDDVLYANISQSDEYEGVSDNRKYIDSDTPFISFTRDKNYSIQGDNRSLVCFVFDGDDIQKIRNARLYPFSFGGYGREESEERVYGVDIKPLHKYLKRIEIKLSNKPYSWSSDRQFDEEDDLYEEFETKYPELSQREIDKMISDYLVDKITNNKLVGNKVVIKNNVNESGRAFGENTQKLDVNDIHYIINETKERLLLNEISNNAIETLFKKYIPWITEIFDLTLKEVRSLGKRPGDTREGIYGMKGAAYCNELGIVNDDIINNPEMKIKDWLRLKIMKEFEINRGRGPIQFIRGIIRICCADDDISLFSRSTTDMTNQNTKLNIKKFKQIIGYIMSKNLNFNEDLNGLGFKELNRSIGAKLRHEAYDNWIVEKDKRNGIQQVGEYQVIPMYGFEDTSKYSEYTSWCVTQRRSHYVQYTSDGSQFFFCLKNGFEDVKFEQGENCPLDEYGLSMVSVLVRSNGEIKHVTTRWNHDNNGEDNPQLRTFEQIEEVLGIPESLFTVNIAPELDFEDIPELIQKHGIDKVLHTITNVGGFKIVEYNRKRNVIHDDKLLSDKWFDSIETTDEGFFQCINNDHCTWEYNIIDKKGLVFPENFPHARFKVYNPDKDLFIVDIAGESALYKRGSNFAISEKFKHITKIYNGYARADNYGYYNFYDENGKKTWDEWKAIKIKDKEYWHDGFQQIFNTYGRSNFINIKTGEILLDEWYLETSVFYDGTALVKNENGLYNFVKTDGTLVSEKWYENMKRSGEYYVVKIGEEETFLDKNGQYPIKKTWKHAINFNGNYGLVRHDNNDNVTVIIDKNAHEIADVNMNCMIITNGNAILGFNEDFKFSVFDINGNYLLPPNLKFTTLSQSKMKEKCFYYENEETGEIYELNLENGEISEINR